MPQISVIVPVYKVESYLDRCVQSVLNQTFSDFELILVDDGSPDRCGAMCDNWATKDARIHVIHKENGGLSDARNAGINWAFTNSNSEWLSFIDSDDWVHEKYLERLYQAAVDHRVGVSACNYITTHGEQPIIDNPSTTPIVLLPEMFYREYGIDSAWGKLYQKALFRHVRYPIGKIYEDTFTTHKLVFQCDQIAWSKVPLYMYYMGGTSITRSKWKPKQLDLLEAFREHVAFFVDNHFHEAAQRAAKRNMWAIAYQYVSVSRSEYTKGEQRHYHKKIRQEWKERRAYFHNELSLSYAYIFVNMAGCLLTEKLPKLYEKINRWRRK